MATWKRGQTHAAYEQAGNCLLLVEHVVVVHVDLTCVEC